MVGGDRQIQQFKILFKISEKKVNCSTDGLIISPMRLKKNMMYDMNLQFIANLAK
ncbi:UNKNOWN [Stylonychia lemnae]|uniref:Uncharacterized protein n=1 Tax=Stylonychia lemnae TaxID=5949 RepID=A0A078ALG8_STYLE|nr:UNKNOWN [Stylonychia lemnae]|eukprot:CDW81703.1 UNKNOWN [Stylonychia lemnae]